MSITFKNTTIQVGTKTLLDQIDLKIVPGKLTGIVGPNGAGKTTLLKSALGLLSPITGNVNIASANVNSLSLQQRADQMSYYTSHGSVAWPLNVQTIVSMGLKKSAKAPQNDLKNTLKDLQLTGLENRLYDSLSSGQQVRVHLARMLINGAPVLLLDEPTAQLEPKHQISTMELLKNLTETRGYTIVIVLHDLTLASRFCDQIALINHGKLIAHGTPDAVLCDDNLQSVFGVSALRIKDLGQSHAIPWDVSQADVSKAVAN